MTTLGVLFLTLLGYNILFQVLNSTTFTKGYDRFIGKHTNISKIMCIFDLMFERKSVIIKRYKNIIGMYEYKRPLIYLPMVRQICERELQRRGVDYSNLGKI